ncbi:Polynucleotide 5'-hydroxyl-kinase grc3 [Mortierella alpina]|uniref:Polynucleotide 5'-hydroxyl-kinase GRC3 n=1 Tax=Mortierella alpina TaxID=64518 RepID=A0A9P6IZV9_MORAP|nr:Polynucleotide 5'-hydroxyl-kinase grc3 [Mortierella alpina]
MPPKAKKQRIVSSTSTTSTVSVTTTSASATSAPLSALAARRQKLLAVDSKASTPEIEEHLEVDLEVDNLDVDEEEKASLDSHESGDDDTDSENSDPEDDDAVDPVLAAKSPSTPQYERRDRKQYLDPQSVSSFKPSRYNVAYSTAAGLPVMMLVGMKRGETLVFQGCATIIPLIGHSTVLGYTMSGTAEKRRVGSKKGAARSGEPKEIDLSSISSFDVFSPKTHALAVIEAISMAGSQRNLMVPQRTFPTSPELRAQLETQLAQLTLGDYDTIIAIQSASGCGILGIEKVVPLFKGILSIKQNSRLRGNEDDERLAQIRFESSLSGFHPILEPTDGIAALQVPATWKDAMQVLINATVDENGGRVKRPPVSVVCGGKKMGKSTFSRLILNRMLNRYRKVAFIECDIGQSEFTPVGMVALHVVQTPALGAPFTHPRQPYRAFFVGNSTPRDDPDYYMACIKELVRTYYAEVSHTRTWDDTDDDYHSDDDEDEHIPLVINTQGWIKGMGYDLLLQLLDYTAPSHIFGFHSPSNGESNLPQSFFTTMKEQAHLAGRQQPSFSYVSAVVLGDESSASPFTKYHPADHRALALLSYFYLSQERDMDLTDLASSDKRTWDFSQALVVRRPWCWDWNQAKGIWVLFDQVPPSQILHVLNASLVALTGDKEDRVSDGSGTLDGNQQQQPEPVTDATPGKAVPLNYFPLGQYPPPPPEHTTCHGLAIIRSIQPSTHTLHILTPIPLVKLRKCNGIVKGAIHMPIHASLDHNEENSKVPGVAGVPWKNVPYLNYEISSSSYMNGSQSPSAGNQSPRLGFAPASKIIGADAKVIRKNLGRKRLQS